MQKKRIIIIGPAHPLRGGIAAFNERLAVELQSNGHEVTIFTFSLQYPSFLFPGKTQLSASPAPKNIDIRVKINSINPFNWIQVARQIKSLKPDHVIARFWIPFIGPSTGSICRLIKNKNLRITGLLDNVVPHEPRAFDKSFTSWFLKSADDFVVMSNQVADELKTFTGKPFKIIPHPVYDHYGNKVDKHSALKELNLPDRKYILFFGLIRDYKGLDLLLDAMADDRIKNSGLQLIVAGEFYGDENKYREQVMSSNIKSLVHFFNEYIPDDRVKYFFSVASLLVQPYRSATQSGITQIGYHFELPMIVSNVGGLREIVPNDVAGYVVPPDPQKIADAIIAWHSDPHPERFVEGSMKQKEKFSWKTFANSIME